MELWLQKIRSIDSPKRSKVTYAHIFPFNLLVSNTSRDSLKTQPLEVTVTDQFYRTLVKEGV